MVSKIADSYTNRWDLDEKRDIGQTSYFPWILGSFIVSSIVHHIISPMIFGRFLPAYRNLSYNKQREWDSRVLSTLHAICVCHFGFISLFSDSRIWHSPVDYYSHEGNVALAIAAGYMVCDMFSMPFYWSGLGLFSFIVHHITVLISAYILLTFKKGCFFGLFRLVSEFSTPFLNMRWFLRTLGRLNGEKPVRIAAYSFFAAFYISRIFSIPVFWYIFYSWYGSNEHLNAVANHPYITEVGMAAAISLDVLNIIWAKSVFSVFTRTYRSSHVAFTSQKSTDQPKITSPPPQPQTESQCIIKKNE